MPGRRLILLLAVFATAVLGAAPQQEWRAASLASFDEVWQTITDTFFEPTFGGVNWVGARAEFRPKAEGAQSPDGVRQVIREMLARLKRSHFVLMSASASDALPGTAVVPIDIRLIGTDLVITRVGPAAAAAGLRPGDVIARVDRQPATSWWAAAELADARAKALDVWRRATRALYGATGSLAAFAVRGADGAERLVSAPRVDEDGEIVALGNLPPFMVRVESREVQTDAGKRVGVIAFNIWMTAIDAPVAAAVDRYRGAAGLVIDLRGNPGGLAEMMRGISGHLLDEPALLGRMRMRAVPQPLEFRANPRRSTADGRRVTPYAGPVALLVDELTASASECFTGALQSLGRARVFGRQTMGQALPAATRQLPNGDVLMYAVGDFVTSTGRSLEGAGVMPDEVIALTAADLTAGRDAVMAAALRWIDAR